MSISTALCQQLSELDAEISSLRQLLSACEGHRDAVQQELYRAQDRAEKFMDRWLGYAAALPLTLIIQSTTQDFPLDRLRSMIYRYSHQVQALALDVGACSDIGELGLYSQVFPVLHQVLGLAPQLYELHLPQAVALTAPWLQLTRFEGQIESIELFDLAPNLIEAKCCLLYTHNNRIIAHASLQILTVINDSVDILEFLTLPSLQSLDIFNMIEYYSLVDFFERSTPPLVSLCVRGEFKQLDLWHDCLPFLHHNLKNLEIRCVSGLVMNPLFGCKEEKNLSILRNLKSLTCSDVAYNSFNLRALVDFLRSRSDTL
ncbi:hypothetical protein B0H17DRAFT_1153819 [Mycena rosella]|uniref:Uncharacterized protein n=1 Tax=Mycena rosella TaxID=1033263 RepID=A0AAD7B203_MYCRO|nr:hypothetical protein B0H17DRAFT_1153819 [Mycena rosella]